jgi:hypothetical protein
MESVASALQANAANLSFDSISGEDIVKSMEQDGHEFYFEADKENWPGIKYGAKRKQSTVRGLPAVATKDTGCDTASEQTTPSEQASSSERDTVTGTSVDEYDWNWEE